MRKSIQYIMLVFLLWFVSWEINAQVTAKVGDTTTLSASVMPKGNYTWELYVPTQGLDFAKMQGNCPATSATFIGSNTGETVQVQWLKAGTYFYKITVETDCTKNFKAGKVIVSEADIPSTPTISVQYNCTDGTAVLQAENYTGTLLWSTGETASTITVNTRESSFVNPTTYTLIQIVNGTQSLEAKEEIETITQPDSPQASVVPTTIYLGETATLTASPCTNGQLHWYSDKNLTDELTDLEVSPKQTTSYYAVCRTEAGCESPSTEVVLKVVAEDSCTQMFENMNIPNIITPNNNGTNDKWIIEDLKEYCEVCNKNVTLLLFNKWGVKVYEKENYMLDNERFEGYSINSRTVGKEKLPEGTYFYILESSNGNSKQGYLYISTK